MRDPGKEGTEKPLVFASFDEAINALSWGEYKDEIDDVFVIGGAQLYESALMHPDLNEVNYSKTPLFLQKFVSSLFFMPRASQKKNFRHHQPKLGVGGGAV